MSRERLVVVGNGMAGVRTLEELLRHDPDRYEISVFGAEPHPNYNRILLSPVLAGESTFDDIILNDFEWYADHGITLHCGRAVTSIDRARRVVIDAAGSATGYDRLILATGSLPIMLPIPGRELPGVLAYRDIADTQAMIEASRCHRHAAVIGGGLLGLEAACGLAARGMQVTVVHLAPWLMERQLDATAAQLLQQSLEARGLDFRLASNTQALLAGPDARVAAVQLADGSSVAADLVVMAIGIRPNTLLAEAAGLECARGIVVDDTLQTSDAHIYAVGECASHRGCCYGLVAPLVEQAAVLAEQLAGRGTLRYTGSVLSTKLKVTGIEVFSAGDFQTDPGADELVLADPEAGIYRKLVLREGRLVGACLYGDTGESSWYLELLRGEHAIAELRDELMFGRPEATAGEPPHAPEVARAAA